MSPRSAGRSRAEAGNGNRRRGAETPSDPDPDDDADGLISSDARRLEALIGSRVRDRSREIGLTSSQLADRVGLSRGMISKIENAQVSPSLGTVARLADALDVPVTSLFQGLDEERDALFTRAGAGPELSRPGTVSGHRYQLLGSMRGPAKRMEPMIVTLTSPREVFPLYQHPGTELVYMLEGEMAYGYAGAEYELSPGDALQFDGEVAHGPTRLGQLPVRFLSVTAYGRPPGDGEARGS